MSWQMSGAVKLLSKGASGEDLLVSEKLTLLLLAEYYNEDEGCAWISVSRLASEALCSERTLYRVLSSLQQTHKLIFIEKDERGRNIYRILLGTSTDILSSPRVSTHATGVTPDLTPVAQTPDTGGTDRPGILIERNESKEEEKNSSLTESITEQTTESKCRACGEVGRHTCLGYQNQKGKKSKIRPIRTGRTRHTSDFSPSNEVPKQESPAADHGFNVSEMRLYRELRKLYKENTGKSFGDLGRESAEKWLEACSRHGPELIEKAFWVWLEAKGKGKYVKGSERPGVIFVYDIEGFVIDATTQFKPKQTTSDPNAPLLLSEKGKNLYEKYR